MARSVFYSFHYQNDIWRVNEDRNRWVTQGGQLASGIIYHAEFEKIKRQGDTAVCSWIDKQLENTTATIVLIGSETLERKFVQYEIRKSVERGNVILGVKIHNLEDRFGQTSVPGRINTPILMNDRMSWNSGRNMLESTRRFNEIADGIYDYVLEDGYNNLDKWVEACELKQFARRFF
jgi:hypothetical protein